MKTAKDLKIPYSWEERRPLLLDRFLYIPDKYEYSRLIFPFFPDEKPIIIEYCSGNGEWIGERAKQNPQFNWIAVEKRFDRSRKIWLKLHRESISNLIVVCSEALVFTRFYAPPEIAEMYINFPDPWPKRRHAKHRLIQAEFLEEIQKIMRPGGQAICVTDDKSYAEEIGKEFAKCPNWKFLFNVNEWPSYGRSFFNDLWLQKGRIIHYLSYEKKS